ncbi:MAG: hypothetical protein IPG23_19260 [Burkholderiales bacterium]|nr:hypothetical protein [Burkholderiales bacterium]
MLLDPSLIFTIDISVDSNVSGATPFVAPLPLLASTLSVATLQTALSSSDVLVSTASSFSSKIDVLAPVTWTSGHALKLQSDSYGGIGINAALDAGPTGSVILSAGGEGIFGGGIITAKSLGIQSGWSVNLNGLNMVETLAANISNGSLYYQSARASGLTIGTVGPLNGVTANSNVAIQSNGPLTLNQKVKSNVGFVHVDSGSSAISGSASLESSDIVLQTQRRDRQYRYIRLPDSYQFAQWGGFGKPDGRFFGCSQWRTGLRIYRPFR